MNMNEAAFFAPQQERVKTKEEIRTEAREKARGLFAERAISEMSFAERDVYEREMVERHLAEVARLDAIFEADRLAAHENAPYARNNEVKEYGDILEGLIFDQIERAGWFGDGVRPVKTSKFDDYKNGVDMLVELEGGRKPLALAVDVTFGFKGMKKKVDRILDEIDNNTLGFIRYYRSQDSSYEGKLGKLARVVVGIEMDTIQDLAAAWVKDGGDEMLRDHYAQTLILSEIAIQLRAYESYARRTGKEEVARVYGAELEKIEDILATKPDAHMDSRDRVYDTIVQVVNDVGRM